MKQILICTDPSEVRGHIKMIYPKVMENPDTGEELPMVLCVYRWKCQNTVKDLMIIIYWLNYILSQNAVDLSLMFCIYGIHGWNSWKNLQGLQNKCGVQIIRR